MLDCQNLIAAGSILLCRSIGPARRTHHMRELGRQSRVLDSALIAARLRRFQRAEPIVQSGQAKREGFCTVHRLHEGRCITHSMQNRAIIASHGTHHRSRLCAIRLTVFIISSTASTTTTIIGSSSRFDLRRWPEALSRKAEILTADGGPKKDERPPQKCVSRLSYIHKRGRPGLTWFGNKPEIETTMSYILLLR